MVLTQGAIAPWGPMGPSPECRDAGAAAMAPGYNCPMHRAGTCMLLLH